MNVEYLVQTFSYGSTLTKTEMEQYLGKLSNDGWCPILVLHSTDGYVTLLLQRPGGRVMEEDDGGRI